MIADKKETMQTANAQTRTFSGVVLSSKENQTIHVSVKTIKMHLKYKKQYTTSKKYAVHDEKNEAKEGDTVAFVECRPLSKTKRWRLTRILRKAE